MTNVVSTLELSIQFKSMRCLLWEPLRTADRLVGADMAVVLKFHVLSAARAFPARSLTPPVALFLTVAV
jgi:hypothetical protein